MEREHNGFEMSSADINSHKEMSMQNGFFVLPSSRALPLSPTFGVCSIELLGSTGGSFSTFYSTSNELPVVLFYPNYWCPTFEIRLPNTLYIID